MTPYRATHREAYVGHTADRPADPTGHFFVGQEYWEDDGLLRHFLVENDPAEPGRLRWLVQPFTVAGDFAIYVDATTGLDTNTGTTTQDPIRTLTGLRERLPQSWGGRARVHFAAGTYAWPADPADVEGRRIFIGSPTNPLGEEMIWIGGFDQIWPADPEAVITATGVSASGLTFTAAALGATANQLQGKVLRIVSVSDPANAANIGARVPIAWNSTTALALQLATPAPLAIGDTAVVEEPNVIFDAPTAAGWSGQNDNGSYLDLYGIRLVVGDTMDFTAVRVGLVGVEFDLTGTGGEIGSVVFRVNGAVRLGLPLRAGDDFFSPTLDKAGVYFYADGAVGGTAYYQEDAVATGRMVSRNVLQYVLQNSQMELDGLEANASPVVIESSTFALNPAASLTPGTVQNARIYGVVTTLSFDNQQARAWATNPVPVLDGGEPVTSGIVGALQLQGGGRILIANNTTFFGNDVDCIMLQSDCMASLGAVLNGGALGLTANARRGVEIRDGSGVVLPSALGGALPAAFFVAGTGGDWRMSGVADTWANLLLAAGVPADSASDLAGCYITRSAGTIP